jgi:hypothetical protein
LQRCSQSVGDLLDLWGQRFQRRKNLEVLLVGDVEGGGIHVGWFTTQDARRQR